MLIDYNLYKKMVRKLALGLIFVVVLVSLVSADTEIKVKTLADHKVYIYVLKPGDLYALLESYPRTSDSNGEVSIVFSGGSVGSKIDVKVDVKKSNVMVFTERFEDYEVGKPIWIRMDYQDITGTYNPNLGKVNETAETKNKTGEESVAGDDGGEQGEVGAGGEDTQARKLGEEDSNQKVTGLAVSNDVDESSSGALIYIIVVVGVLGFLIVIFFVAKHFMLNEQGVVSGINVKTAVSNNRVVNNDREIHRLQRELEAAKREIAGLKKEEKIKEIERKIDEEKRELSRLRRENFY